MNRQDPRLHLPERLDDAEFQYVQGMVKEHTAISLDTSKVYLINARLLPVARAHGLPSVLELIRHLRSRPFGELHWKSVEAIVTTETSFFRDFFPFDAMRRNILPDLIRSKQRASRSITIWCAGCSSGQEPFSIAMLLREHFPELNTWPVRIYASDFSTTILDRAKSGRYSQIEVNRGLPANLLVKYFKQNGATWQINRDIRNMVTFFQHNLVRDFPTHPTVDILLLRNVLIYFDVDTKRLILNRVRRQLRPGGLLMLGTAETTLNLDERFERVRVDRAVFYRTGEAEAR